MHQSQFQNHYFGHHTRGWPDNCFYCWPAGKTPRDIFSCRKLQMSHRHSGTKIQFLVPSCYMLPRSLLLPRSTRNSAEPVKRLWRTLVHQESIKELFIQNIFKREMASNEEVSPLLISLLFPISFSFSSFFSFFPPSFLLLWLSLSSPSSNSFYTTLSPSLDPFSFLFFSSLPPSYFSPSHPFFPAPCSFPAFSPFFLCHFLPLTFWSRSSFLFLLPSFVWAILRLCERLGHCCIEL